MPFIAKILDKKSNFYDKAWNSGTPIENKNFSFLEQIDIGRSVANSHKKYSNPDFHEPEVSRIIGAERALTWKVKELESVLKQYLDKKGAVSDAGIEKQILAIDTFYENTKAASIEWTGHDIEHAMGIESVEYLNFTYDSVHTLEEMCGSLITEITHTLHQDEL